MSSSADRLNNKRLLKKMLSHAQLMVAMCAQIGVALRISLSALESRLLHSQALIVIGSNYFFPNILGCVFLSWLIRERLNVQRFSPALFVGLSTGLCGR